MLELNVLADLGDIDDSMKAYLREQRDLGETSSSGRMTVDKKSVPAC